MEEEEYKDAARIYSEMIVLGDSLFRVYTGERVEDMRKDYTIDELELQNSAQQKRLLQLSFIIILSLAVFLLGGFFYLKKVGKRLLHSKNELQKAKSMAEESIRNKSLFLSNMSHEIKTPLNALAGFSEVLTTPGIDEATRVQCNDVIQLNSELLLKLINDVVDISCLDVANMKFSIAPVMDPKEIHSQTIFFGKVHLRVSPDFRKRCAGYVERAKYGFRKSAELSGAERYRRLLAFFGDTSFHYPS